MTFLTYAKEKRELIEKRLIDFLDNKGTVLPTSFKEQRILSNLQDFIFRGKLLRGTLFLFTAEMLGKKIDDDLLDSALAIEIAHSSLLIHDDIIDNDEIRRGEKSIHKIYEERGSEIKAKDFLHYGKSIAIVAGDIGFFLAIELLSRSKNPKNLDLLRFYSREITNVGFAQGIDSEYGQTDKEISREEILEVYRFKTARYTFSLPMIMAGIVSGASDATLEVLDELGENAGIIFQIKDDELGLFGTEEKIGKPIGSDIRENKKTLIRAILFEKVDAKEKEKLNDFFGNPKIGKIEVGEVISFCEKYNVREELERESEVIMGIIWNLYENLKVDAYYKKILKEFLEFNLKRAS